MRVSAYLWLASRLFICLLLAVTHRLLFLWATYIRVYLCLLVLYMAPIYPWFLCSDALAWELTGLLHDVGHGPFSHVFDNEFLPRAQPGANWFGPTLPCRFYNHLSIQINCFVSVENNLESSTISVSVLNLWLWLLRFSSAFITSVLQYFVVL